MCVNFRASAVEQRQVVVEVFDKLTRMQKLVSWIQGEMSLLDMMGFYFACVLFGFFGTSSRRTQSARFWIVLLCIVVLGLERCLFNHLNSLDSYSPVSSITTITHLNEKCLSNIYNLNLFRK